MTKAQQGSRIRTKESLLSNRDRAPSDIVYITDVPTFSTSYSVDFAKIKNIFFKYLPMLSRDSTLREILTDGCRCVAKRGKSLGNILCPSDFSSNISPKTWLFQLGFIRVAAILGGILDSDASIPIPYGYDLLYIYIY